MQRSIVSRMHDAMLSNTPNVFLIDIGSGELDGVRQLVLAQPGAEKNFEALPILSGNLVSLEGTPIRLLDHKRYPIRLRRTLSFTWSDAPPPGISVVKGAWWKVGDAHAVAVIDRVANRLQLHIGSKVGFGSDGQQFDSTVSAIYKVDGQHISSRSEFIFAPAELKGMPVVWYAAMHMRADRIAQLQRVLFAHYPTVTAINIAGHSRHDSAGRGADHHCDPLPRWILHSFGNGDPGFEYREHALPQGTRSGGAEDARCDAAADSRRVLSRVPGAGSARRHGRSGFLPTGCHDCYCTRLMCHLCPTRWQI